mmetsp:Transcript_68151/g.192131  ORF Transcript_68151/g.192131 Transcript_68151/m.192131 type:complete len:214 (-) Transcript_68151:526-1167(-)
MPPARRPARHDADEVQHPGLVPLADAGRGPRGRNVPPLQRPRRPAEGHERRRAERQGRHPHTLRFPGGWADHRRRAAPPPRGAAAEGLPDVRHLRLLPQRHGAGPPFQGAVLARRPLDALQQDPRQPAGLRGGAALQGGGDHDIRLQGRPDVGRRPSGLDGGCEGGGRHDDGLPARHQPEHHLPRPAPADAPVPEAQPVQADPADELGAVRAA